MNKKRFFAIAIVLVIIILFSAWVRFDGLTEQGIFSGADAFKYIKESKLWAAGRTPEFIGGKFYRPAAYLLMGMAIRIFGYNDYSIKIIHGILDMLSILLIFMIASMLANNPWVGVVSSLIYAFLPEIVRMCRWEILHIESTFFVLLALFFFILFARKQTGKIIKLFLLFMSGFSLGLAANTHADLAFLAPGYVLYLFIQSYNSQNKGESLKKFIILAVIFTFSFFTPYLLGFLIFGAQRIIQVFLNEVSSQLKSLPLNFGQASKLQIFFRILLYSIKYYFGKHFFLMGILVIGSIFLAIYRKITKETDPLLTYLPFILIFSYAFFYAGFIPAFNATASRYLMPLVPLIIFIITRWYFQICRQLFKKYSVIIFIFLFAVIFLINPKVLPGGRKYYSIYRSIHNILKYDVNRKNKLLIAPAIIYSADSGFQSDLYFGEDAMYLVDLPVEDKYDLPTLKKLLKETDVRYVFLGKKLVTRWLEPENPLPYVKNHHAWLRNEKNPYSLARDLKIIMAYIRSKGGVLIDKNRFGKIYFLTGEDANPESTSLIPNGSLEYWRQSLPMGEWVLVSGKISRSLEEFTEGLYSLCLEPADKTGTRLKWAFSDPLPFPEGKDRLKLRIKLDAKSSESGKFFIVFHAYFNKKWQKLEPGFIRYSGNGDWQTISGDFIITADMKFLNFNLWLRGAKQPAFVDNLSLSIIKE